MKLWNHHLKVKLQTLGLLAGGALLLSGLLFGLAWLLQPLLPASWQALATRWEAQPIQQMQQFKIEAGNAPLLPFYFILFQIGQVVIAPIPGQLMGLLGGWLFGFWGGLSLTMLGLSVGSLLAMLIGRYGGRWLLDRLLSHEVLLRFDHMVAESGLFTFFMLFLLPGLPDDALCLVAGMTALRLPWLLGLCVVGRLPGMAVLTWVGTELGQPDRFMTAVLAGIGLLSFLLWLFQEPIELAFASWSKKPRSPNPR